MIIEIQFDSHFYELNIQQPLPIILQLDKQCLLLNQTLFQDFIINQNECFILFHLFIYKLKNIFQLFLFILITLIVLLIQLQHFLLNLIEIWINELSVILELPQLLFIIIGIIEHIPILLWKQFVYFVLFQFLYQYTIHHNLLSLDYKVHFHKHSLFNQILFLIEIKIIKENSAHIIYKHYYISLEFKELFELDY